MPFLKAAKERERGEVRGDGVAIAVQTFQSLCCPGKGRRSKRKRENVKGVWRES